MTEPIVIVFSTNIVAGIALVCALIVTVLAVLDYRRRGRLVKRALSEMEAGRECRDTSKDYISHISTIKNGPADWGAER